MIRSNSKVYKFKICIDGYTLDYAQKYIDKNILNKYSENAKKILEKNRKILSEKEIELLELTIKRN